MKGDVLVTIIVTNYNYEKYLLSCIDSVLNQDYKNYEVILVDDNSNDGSRNVIKTINTKVTCIQLDKNEGQANAFYEGFLNSHGQIIIFLDADDLLKPNSVSNIVKAFESENVDKVQWAMEVIDESGKLVNSIIPTEPLPQGNFFNSVMNSGPPFFLNPPTSGNAWSRKFLESVFPLKTKQKIGADQILFELFALVGNVKSLPSPNGYYRIHSKNNYYNKSFIEKLDLNYKIQKEILENLIIFNNKLGGVYESNIWIKNAWFLKLKKAVDVILTLVKEGEYFILVDDDTWGLSTNLKNRHVLSLSHISNEFLGPPIDDINAIKRFKSLLNNQPTKIIFSWNSFWWVDHYKLFYEYLCGIDEPKIYDDLLIAININSK